MSPSHALTAAPARRWSLIQRAPCPEAPAPRDRMAAQRGMMIALGAGALFWGGVAAVALRAF